MKYEIHWVSACGCCIGEPYKDKYHGTFDTLDEAQESVRNWWKEHDYKPPYIRQVTRENGDVWWDYGLHRCFYIFKQAKNKGKLQVEIEQSF